MSTMLTAKMPTFVEKFAMRILPNSENFVITFGSTNTIECRGTDAGSANFH